MTESSAERLARAVAIREGGDPERARVLLLETTADQEILAYRRALTAYAEDLDRSWLGGP